MAIVDWEGFDRETSIGFNQFSSANGWSVSSDGQGFSSYGRYASSANGTMERASWFPLMNDGFFQSHCYFDYLPNNQGLHIVATKNGAEQITVRLMPASQLVEIWRNNVVVQSSSFKYPVSIWFFIQIRFNCLVSGGSVEVRINGQTAVTFTGNAAQTGSDGWNGWKLWYIATPTARVDNILVYSATGDSPASWTPETRIWEDLPNGAGATTGWTASAGSNYQCVDEQPSNGDTDYVSASSAGLTDTYAFPSPVPAGAIVYAVGARVNARKDDAGLNEIDLVLRSGGTNYASGVPRPLSTSYARYSALWNLDPATSAAWTVANANAAQAGIRRTS